MRRRLMSDYKFKEHDFEHPSILFILEDKLKGLLGGPLFYTPYCRTFGLEGNENVLDFGCGGGIGSQCLVKLLKDGHLTCVDISHYWIEKAKMRLNKYNNIECKAGDIRELDIPDSSFDIISTIHVIHDINPEERQGTINALSRKLKVGGLLFIKERIEKSHGMPVEEIRVSFSNAGLKEIDHKETKVEYLGKYRKL
jgi:ubiquinone/menaquinone biosynthesis C-methylase UbiE